MTNRKIRHQNSQVYRAARWCMHHTQSMLFCSNNKCFCWLMDHMANLAKPGKMLRQTPVMRADIKTQIEIMPHQFQPIAKRAAAASSKRQNHHSSVPPLAMLADQPRSKEWERSCHSPFKADRQNRKRKIGGAPHLSVVLLFLYQFWAWFITRKPRITLIHRSCLLTLQSTF